MLGKARRTVITYHSDVVRQRRLGTLYRPLLDTLHFFDNSSNLPRLIFKDEAGQTTINDAALYQRLRKDFPP